MVMSGLAEHGFGGEAHPQARVLGKPARDQGGRAEAPPPTKGQATKKTTAEGADGK